MRSSEITCNHEVEVNTLSDYGITYHTRDNKELDETWDFRRADTKEYTHCFHQYPAMMIPQVARRIIENYGEGAKLLFDPYCGTGTSLVEANLKGIDAIGTDINPLAILIAKAKTTKLNLELLNLEIDHFINYFYSRDFNANISDFKTPTIKNIDFWFHKRIQKELCDVSAYIQGIEDESIQNFFKVAFSETVRQSSYVKPGEFKLVRSKNLKDKDGVDVLQLMRAKLWRNKVGLINFISTCDNPATSAIYDFNTVHGLPEFMLRKKVDIVVTSPPYGDSRTTVAYGQYSRLANEWLGNKNANQIDNRLMGGIKKNRHHFQSQILNDVIGYIQDRDKNRAKDVISFYIDYERSINNISKIIRNNGFACYVVGNRTVKGLNIPTDEITAQLFELNGFTHVETIVRNIPNKRMPLKNSPTNITGKTASTMKNEFIVICQKNLR